MIPVTRPYFVDGKWTGLLLVTVQLKAISELLSEVDLGEVESLALTRTDGYFLARQPFDPALMTTHFTNTASFIEQVDLAASRTYFETGDDGEVERQVSFRRIPNSSMVVSVSMKLDDILRPWYEYLYVILLMASSLTFIIGYLGVVQVRNWEERTQSGRRRLATERRVRRALLEAFPNPVFIEDDQGRFVECNGAFLRLLDRPSERVIGQTVHDLFEADDASFYAAMERRVRSSEAMRQRDMTVPLPDGTRRSYVATLAPIASGDGAATGLIGVLTDIDRQKMTEIRLQEVIAQLERSNEDLQNFAYVASHDLQEPLRMVISYMQLIDRRYREKLDDEGREFLNFAVSGAKRMSSLIRDLLMFSRVDTRGKPMEAFEVQVAVDAALAYLDDEILECGADITVGPMPWVMGDGGQITSLLQNLLSNGMKYRSPDRAPRISLSAERLGSMWRFMVSDNGIGFDNAFSERIFEMFQRLHRSEDYPGTGIGLAICRRIVDRHGGEIRAIGRPGEGATFVFTLRAVDQDADDSRD